MNAVQVWLERAYEHVQDDYDMLVPVVGDEGKGKSTFMTQCGWLWRGITGREQSPQAVVNEQIAWDRGDFKDKLARDEQYSLIAVHDAARVLSRKKAMHGDQIEIEEDLLDMRFGNHIVLLGYQEFDLIPTMLATRRAKQLFRIPERGIVHGHKESNIRKRYENDKWKDPSLRDTFPDISGTPLWNAFKAEDRRRKKERIATDEDEQEAADPVDIAEMAAEDGFDGIVSVHGGHNRLYFDPDLIEIEYGISGNKAKKVKKILARDYNPEEAAGAVR